MTPNSMPLVWMVLLAMELLASQTSAARKPGCGWIAVRAEVEVPAGEVTLANLLDRGTCPTLVAAASRMHLGAAPLAGSPRVLRDDQVRALIAKLEGGEDFAAGGASIPKRITIRRLERTPDSNLAAHLAAPASPGAEGSSRAPASGKISLRAPLVRRGDRVTLAWDAPGIRMTVAAIALDAGSLGEQVRARIEPGGRVMRAVVVDRGQLRTGS